MVTDNNALYAKPEQSFGISVGMFFERTFSEKWKLVNGLEYKSKGDRPEPYGESKALYLSTTQQLLFYPISRFHLDIGHEIGTTYQRIETGVPGDTPEFYEPPKLDYALSAGIGCGLSDKLDVSIRYVHSLTPYTKYNHVQSGLDLTTKHFSRLALVELRYGLFVWNRTKK